MTFSNIKSRFYSLVERIAPRPLAEMKRRRMHEFFSQFIRNGEGCFDIGAHRGDYTGVFLGLGAKVIAVEPVSETAHVLKKRFGDNPNLTVVQEALNDAPGYGKIFLGDRSEISSLSAEFISYYQEHYGHHWNSSEPVKVTTLDELITRFGKPAFIKIDVEGLEESVLKGLNRPVPAISIEFNYPFRGQTEKCVRKLEQLGFDRFNYSLFEEFQFRLNSWASVEEILGILRKLPPRYLTGDVYAKQALAPENHCKV